MSSERKTARRFIDDKKSHPGQECICKSSRSLTIKIDKETAEAFTKAWDSSQQTRLYKLFFNKRAKDEKFLEVDGVVPDITTSHSSGTFVNTEQDNVEKHVVFVKVANDGTFHYELDVSDSDDDTSVASEDNNKTMIKSQDQDHSTSMADDNKVKIQEKITYGSPKSPIRIAESINTTVQNRPPVIILNTANQFFGANEEPVPGPSSPVQPLYPVYLTFPVNDSDIGNEVEINTSMEIDFQPAEEGCDNNVLKPVLLNNTTTTSPNSSQKQLAQVAPFQMVAKLPTKSPRTPKTPKPPVCSVKQDMLNDEIKNCFIKIGPGDTAISGDVYHSINWKSVREATRKLLTALFPREVLATHTLTGKPSPAFRDRQMPTKRQLDSKIVEDIISLVVRKCNVDARTVRSIITLKCADENKMLKMRIAKQRRIQQNKENLKEE